MKRRDFVGASGGVAASWPLAAGARQAVVKVPRVGFIQADPGENVTAIVQGLRDWKTSGDVGTQAN
jgi:hypothetical protein